MVNYPDPHWPFTNVIEGRPVNLVAEKDVVSFSYIGFDNERIRKYTTGLYNGILRLDECIGELMNKLKKSGKERNTLVIFLSDHGDEMARGKFDVYEVGTKVPFLASWPRTIEKGIHSAALVSAIDVIPTILEVAGVSVPERVTGKSLIPLFRKPDMNFRKYLFTEKNCDEVDLYFPRRAIRDKKYKLIYSLLDNKENVGAARYTKGAITSPPLAGCPTLKDLETVPDSIKKAYHDWIYSAKAQLYDLKKDPFEFHDLSSDPKYARVKKRLLKELFKWQKRTDDPLRFPDKLRTLTQENDAIKISKNMEWQYPHYLYGEQENDK